MIRRLLRISFWLGLAAGIAAAVKELLSARRPPVITSGGADPTPWPPLADDPPAPAPSAPWVEPVDGACPAGHPIKAKLSSKIFHAPGSASYDRTIPDRCYADAAAAEADGLRPAKR